MYLNLESWKHQSSASLAFVRGIHRRPASLDEIMASNAEMFPFDDVIMVRCSCYVEFCITFIFLGASIQHAVRRLTELSCEVSKLRDPGLDFKQPSRTWVTNSHEHIMDYYINHTVHQDCILLWARRIMYQSSMIHDRWVSTVYYSDESNRQRLWPCGTDSTFEAVCTIICVSFWRVLIQLESIYVLQDWISAFEAIRTRPILSKW